AERRKRRLVQEKLLDRLEFEILLSELSAEMASLSSTEVDQTIERWIQKLVEFLGAESGSLFKPHEYDAGGRSQSVKEVELVIPIHVDDSTWTLVFRIPSSRRAWRADLVPRIRLAGEILAGAVVRKRNEEAVRRSQERYKLATNSGGVIVWDWHLKTSEFYADPLLKSILGYEDHEISNHFEDWIRLVHPEDVDLVMERLQAHVQGSIPRFEVEHRLLEKGGGIRWFLTSGTLVQSDQDVRMVGTGNDITQRKLTEQELQLLSTRLLDSQDQERRRIA